MLAAVSACTFTPGASPSSTRNRFVFLRPAPRSPSAMGSPVARRRRRGAADRRSSGPHRMLNSASCFPKHALPEIQLGHVLNEGGSDEG